MSTRIHQKEASLKRILESASRRLRLEGLEGGAIAAVMKDAGLTHGAFYSHFANKDELSAAAMEYALKGNRSRWIVETKDASWGQRLVRLARRYLNKAHRDAPGDGCALAAVASEAARGSEAFRRTYEQELKKSLAAIVKAGPKDQIKEKYPEAIGVMALCVGGLLLSRAVSGPVFSDQILESCNALAARLFDEEEENHE